MTTAVRLILAAVLLLVAVPAGAQMQMSVSNACPVETIRATADGAWSDASTWTPARVPTASDSVVIAGGRIVTGGGDVGCVTVGNPANAADKGTWNFSGTFTVTTIQVEAGGDFSTNQPFRILWRDAPIDTSLDPEQNGHGLIIDNGRSYIIGATRSTWVEHTDINVGDTVLHLRAAPVNWRAGEMVIVFDTRQGQNCAVGCTKGAQREVKTIASISGADVTVTTPFQYAHTSVGSPYPSLDGTSKRVYPWAIHIGGDSVFQSQNPNGVRGHAMAVAHADVWWENVTFDQMGRTKMGGTTTTPGGANQIGRYPVHMHHNVGRGPQSNGRAFTLKGLEVIGSPRYCVVIHKSSWGLVEDSSAYDCPAASFYYEDGDEYENISRRNSAVFGIGQGGREDITAGFGFYYRGPWNHTIDNRSANHFNSQGTEAAYGFKYFPKYLNNVQVPSAPGQMPNLTKNSYTQGAITEFSGNTCFADESCFTFWWINTMPFYQEGTQRSLIKNLTAVRIPEKGIFQYEAANMTLDGLLMRDVARPWAGQDYIFKNGIIRNADVQSCVGGFELSPIMQNTEFLMEDSLIACSARQIQFFGNWTSGAAAYPTGPNSMSTRRIRNVQFRGPAKHFIAATSGQTNVVAKNDVFIENYNGTSSSFQWFPPGAAASAILPQHAPAGCTPGTSCSRVGSPVAGETNAQAWAARKLTFWGVPICASPQTSSAFDGFACGTVTPPACTYTVAPLSHASPDIGDSFPIVLTASSGTGCTAWTASSAQPWVTLSQTSGTGTSTITATVAPNTTTSQRTAGLTVNGQSVAVTQAAAPPPSCTVGATPTAHTSPAGGESFSVTVTASGSSCAWTAATATAWLTVTPASSTGGGTATVTVAANTATTARTGTLTIAGTPVTVDQAGATPPTPPTAPTGTGIATPTFRVRCTSGNCVKAEFWFGADGATPSIVATDTTVDAAGNYVWPMLKEPATYLIYAIVYDAQGTPSAQIPLPGR
jgi:hypothetical protein